MGLASTVLAYRGIVFEHNIYQQTGTLGTQLVHISTAKICPLSIILTVMVTIMNQPSNEILGLELQSPLFDLIRAVVKSSACYNSLCNKYEQIKMDKAKQNKALDTVTDKIQEKEFKGDQALSDLSKTQAAAVAAKKVIPAADLKLFTTEFGHHANLVSETYQKEDGDFSKTFSALLRAF